MGCTTCWATRGSGRGTDGMKATRAPVDGRAWESGECSSRVMRGGAWNSKPGDLRSARRVRDDFGLRSNDIGFRVARTLVP